MDHQISSKAFDFISKNFIWNLKACLPFVLQIKEKKVIKTKSQTEFIEQNDNNDITEV